MIREFICRNPECKHVDSIRWATAPQIGVGLYLAGPVKCECGWAAEDVPATDARPR